MDQLQKVFNYGQSLIRTVIKDNEVWFVAKDICEVLEINNPSQALSRLDEDEKNTIILNEGIGNPEKSIVNESGLYSLILGSRKTEAKVFKRWVTHDVLPTIRKTGGYVANDDLFVDTYLKHADESTKLLFKVTLETVRKQNEEIAVMSPKAEYFDALVDRNLLTNFRDTAKELHVKQGFFINWLLDNKYVYRDQRKKLKPYMQYVPNLFELKDWEKNGKADAQTLITPKGKETFRLLLQEKKKA
ncbi:MAG: BRO family protein [Bacillus sp. (in: firmicutes)]